MDVLVLVMAGLAGYVLSAHFMTFWYPRLFAVRGSFIGQAIYRPEPLLIHHEYGLCTIKGRYVLKNSKNGETTFRFQTSDGKVEEDDFTSDEIKELSKWQAITGQGAPVYVTWKAYLKITGEVNKELQERLATAEGDITRLRDEGGSWQGKFEALNRDFWSIVNETVEKKTKAYEAQRERSPMRRY